jgi:glycosyltransferase involved in cell wall biosynthesis
MHRLRIGVNALYLIPGGVGGTEIFLRGLLGGLAEVDPDNEYFVFTNRETGPDLVPAGANFHHTPQPVAGRFRPGRIAWEQTVLPLAAARRRLDLLLNPGFTAPLLAPCPMVTVFHDLQHRRHPEYFRWFDLPAWRLLLYQAALSSDRLVAVSEATRRDLLHFYPSVQATRVHVIHHGVEERVFAVGRLRRQSAPEPFLLCVSTLHPHKNIDRLLRVFASLASRHPDLKLVLAGMRGFHAEAIDRAIARLGLQDRVRLTGWLAREQLLELYRRAHACVYPSTFEGFGLPVLEAMAAGIPTACSAIDPLREIAGEWAVLFDPHDDAAMARALLKVIEDEPLRRRLEQQGPGRAAAFSWRKAAGAYLDLFYQAVSGRRPRSFRQR